jgi:clan AA aspartic protease (TIGR02281 family)
MALYWPNDVVDGGRVMNVHRAPFAYILVVLTACALFPKVATAQYSVAQCTSLHRQLYEEVHKDKKASNKKIISLARENLSHCHGQMNRDLYFVNLRLLALNLNSDNQYLEALDVTNRCLEINAKELFCLAQKADALLHLGRISEATSIVNSALPLSAVTEVEAGAKYDLQVVKLKLNALPHREEPNQIGVPLKKEGGTFVVPVQINGAITLNFTIDSGAADVTVPADVFSTLTRAGTITDADITGEQTYVLADGAKTKSITFTIRSLRVADKVVENVRGSVAPAQGSLLLGQSFLEHFKSWSFDNTKHQLVLEVP